MDKPYGIWSNENCCFVRLCDITRSPLDDNGPLAHSILSFGHADAAVASLKSVAMLSGLRDLEALALREDDRPESWEYVQLQSFADIDRSRAKGVKV